MILLLLNKHLLLKGQINRIMRGKRKLLKDGYVKSTNDFDRIKTALDKGGKFEVIEFWNRTEYWFNHIEGGREKVTKHIYSKLSTH